MQTDNIFISEEQLISIVKDLFTAGVETTNNTIGFIISYLAMKQDVQKKVHVEIERVLGKEVLPRIAYKTRYNTRNNIVAYYNCHNLLVNCYEYMTVNY